MRYFSLGCFLLVFWLALSGHYTPKFIILGVLTAIAGAFAAWRVKLADREGHPVEFTRGAIGYYPWLMIEIAKSSWSVTKIILHPQLPISPTMTTVTATQKSTTGRATFANSITLTPGTVTVGVRGQDFTIHALTKDNALDVETGDMNRRVRQFESPS